MSGKNLKNVTLCCITSTNRALSERALLRSAEQLDFGRVVYFSDTPALSRHLEHVEIPRLASLADYNVFLLSELGKFISTDFVLLLQYDGFVMDPNAWRPEFLDYDYIGARWPWHEQYTVGNGGFSLRSAKLLRASADTLLKQLAAPEDELICRLFRSYLEVRHAIKFAPPEIADSFSLEHVQSRNRCFGFHGLFRLHKACRPSELSEVMSLLDDEVFAGGNALLWVLAMLRDGALDGAGELARRVLAAQSAPKLKMHCQLYGMSMDEVMPVLSRLAAG